jgi:hypothetical protein
MAHPIVPPEVPATVQTRVWELEHARLYALYRAPQNTFPKFRFPDLLSACVSLVFGNAEGQSRLVEFLTMELLQRDPGAARRSCDIWSAQFHQLMAARGASWNRFPNPMFDLDHIATAGVAVAMCSPFGQDVVLCEARTNLRARTKALRAGVN